MSLELKETIQALGKAFDAFKAENDARLKEIEKKGAADPLLTEKVDKINADIAQISALKKRLDTLETAVAQGQFPGGGKNELDRVKAQHKDAFAKFFRKGAEGGLRDLEIQAGLSTLSDPDGGFLVPEDYEQAIDRVALSVSAMRRLATVRTIGTDTYKKLVNKGGASSGWVGEKGARAETNTPTLAEIAINTKEIYAMPAATQTLLDDSRVDIAGWLADEVSIEFSEQESEAFIHGNGVEQPKGIAAYAMAANSSYVWGKVGYITSGNASLVNDLDKLIDLQHALKPVYRNGAAWLMNDATLATIRKMKDGDGNYIWVPGLKDGAPDTLLGKPVEIDDNVDDIGAGKYPIFFANFKRAYLIIDRQGVRVLRDPYTSKPYVLFYTTKRVGGGIVMYEAIKALKVSA
ncbi:MAG: phage major capsid protein [Desulfomonilia bacterium]